VPSPSPPPDRGLRIAVVGSGIAGLAAAYALAARHRVTLLEAKRRLGGDSRTIEVAFGERVFPVDTGFLVHNTLNYPILTALFARLGVPTQPSDMSFGVSAEDGRLEYAGTGLDGLFAQRANLVRPGFIRMLLAIRRFYGRAPALLRTVPGIEKMTLGDLLMREAVPRPVQDDHVLPMAAAIWSTPVERMRAFPAAMYLRFFDSHRLFTLGERPRWRTVTGGARTYVDRIARTLDDVRVATPVTRVARGPDGVAVTAGGRTEAFDQIVLAAHADQTLRLLADPSADERAILGAFDYHASHAVVHRDPRLMPKRRKVWSSWNYIGSGAETGRRISVSYWLNRLQAIDRAYPVFASLNPIREPDPALVFDRTAFAHPIYDLATVAAQARLPAIQGRNRTWYCGAYCGYGFHEDGAVSGLDVAAGLGAAAEWRPGPSPQHAGASSGA
jgi:predicted NAD/FAD-binding protein